MAKKKIKVPVTIIKEEPKTFLKKVWDKAYNSGTVMLNYIIAAGGAIATTFAGIFSSMDWSRPLQMLQDGVNFKKEQWFVIGLSTFALGVVGYLTRVNNTKEIDGHLLPKAPE